MLFGLETTAIVEMWDDKTSSVYVPEFDGFSLNGQGRTVEEAKRSLLDAVDDYRHMFAEKGEEVPEALETALSLNTGTTSLRFLNASSLLAFRLLPPMPVLIPPL